jgi:Ca-activated chloride channel family protein
MSADFIFLRPWWLLALLLLPALFILQRSRRGERNAWQQAVDPHLLPYLIETRGKDPASLRSWLIPLGAAIAIVALAGPSWQQQKTPLWQVKAPLVIAMDLSSAMLAADLAPSRLQQARAKISALLRQRRGGEVGLVAWAGDAFTAAPMTRDAATAQVVVDSLAPGLMPVDGQRADRGIEHAVSIMQSAGFEHGDILLVTDHADAKAEAAAAQARAQGFRVSALGVGTPSGAPMTSASGFVSDARGQVQLARLDLASLRALAARGGGTAVALTVDGSDLDALGVLNPQGPATQATGSGGAGPNGNNAANATTTVQRSDDGYWLVLLLLPLALLGFRRQQALAALPLMLTLGLLWQPAPAEAATAVPAGSAVSAPMSASSPASATPPSDWESAWAGLWQRKDQRARAALASGDLAQARALAPDPALRGAAAYRNKDWSAAAQDFGAADSADAQYNLGNALAMAGDYQQALAAYDKALAQEPGMADALANRKAVEDALKRKPPEQDSQEQDKSAQGKPGDDKQQDKQEQDESKQNQQAENSHGEDKPDQSQQGANQQDHKQQEANEANQNQQDQGQQGKNQQDQSQSGHQSPKSRGSPAAEQSGSEQKPQLPVAKPAASADAQREADAAARREIQEALARQSGSEQASEPAQPAKSATPLSPAEREKAEHQQALQQWLRRVPDDPGGLLRWKFALEYERRQQNGDAP